MPATNGLNLQLWCLVKGNEDIFRATAPIAADVEQVKEACFASSI
jgi:hypothetical protein